MIPHSRPTLDEEEIAAVTRVLSSGYVTQGKEVLSFEKELAMLVGASDAAAVSSGTAALHLALVALEIGAGDEVIIPSFVCTSLLNAVRYVHATPILADINLETFNIDARDIRRRLSKRTKAVIVPHMFGLPADIDDIIALGIPVIEDCAQSLGSCYRGAPTGGFGLLSVFSFYATKVICTGEGGMIAACDPKTIHTIKDIRDYDEKREGDLRYNYKLTDIQAALGLAQLEKLSAFLDRRRAIARQYDEFLQEYDLCLPFCPPGRESIYYRYIIRTRQLETFLNAGQTSGIAYRRPVFKPLHHYLGLTGYPQTEEAFLTAVSLPIYPSLSDADIECILHHIHSLLK